jgi:1,4-dihydroxy-2-naphthoate octaprenyltransferase
MISEQKAKVKKLFIYLNSIHWLFNFSLLYNEWFDFKKREDGLTQNKKSEEIIAKILSKIKPLQFLG